MNHGGPGPTHSSFLGPRIVAAVVVVGAVLLITQALQIGEVAGYSVVGPSTIPLAVSVVLLGLGVLFVIRTTVRPDRDLAELAGAEEAATHWTTIGWLALALVIYALALNGFRLGPLAIPGLGYVVATAIFLPVAARMLGSDRPVRDLVIGAMLAVVIYVGFTEFLGVRLPAGLLGLIG